MVVSHYIDEYKNRSDLFWMSHKNEELPALFAKALQNLMQLNSLEQQEKRKKIASENTYMKQLERIENLLDKHSKLR
jgi:hypothetical protein